MANIKEMFREQNRTARQLSMKGLGSTKMVEGTPVREYVLKMMGYLYEMDVLGASMDAESQVDIILASLPESLNMFVLNCDMNKLEVTMSDLLNMLRSAENPPRKNRKSTFVAEGSIPTTPKPKGKGKNRKGKGLRKNVLVNKKGGFKKKSQSNK
ncbi:uncharacterized protein LOC143892064 [Tasmannia lanceolata]|uniref:uncharacterized protein LOC143892064 n=1 Tax=Tasmannia lanceolata TaxID=3420 RepID=UPI004064825A